MHSSPDTPDVVASKNVCLELDINRSTLTRWVEAGRITPAFQLPGDRGAFVFHRADVDALKAEIAERKRAEAERAIA